jgi:hypothetical protein
LNLPSSQKIPNHVGTLVRRLINPCSHASAAHNQSPRTRRPDGNGCDETLWRVLFYATSGFCSKPSSSAMVCDRKRWGSEAAFMALHQRKSSPALKCCAVLRCAALYIEHASWVIGNSIVMVVECGWRWAGRPMACRLWPI